MKIGSRRPATQFQNETYTILQSYACIRSLVRGALGCLWANLVTMAILIPVHHITLQRVLATVVLQGIARRVAISAEWEGQSSVVDDGSLTAIRVSILGGSKTPIIDENFR
jgi:hypothetical protein